MSNTLWIQCITTDVKEDMNTCMICVVFTWLQISLHFSSVVVAAMAFISGSLNGRITS